MFIIRESIKKINYELKKEFCISCRKFWANMAKKINYKDSRSFFPQINSMFRNKEFYIPKPIKIPPNQTQLLIEAGINPNSLKNINGEYIVHELHEILNLFGVYFASVNSYKTEDPEKHLHNLISSSHENLTQERTAFNESEYEFTTFSDNNPSYDPESYKVNDISLFTSVNKLSLIIKRISNKTSFGIDRIPNIVLKNLPLKIIKDLTSIINNCIINAYYPISWKKSKILPFAKKRKDLAYLTSSPGPLAFSQPLVRSLK